MGEDKDKGEQPQLEDFGQRGRVCLKEEGTATSANMRLSFKLKIPNGLAVDGAGDSSGSVANNNGVHRVCDVCGKVFTSGKAYGGHKRIHVQARKKAQNQSMKKQGRAVYLSESGKRKDNNGVKDEVSCFVCGKSFASMKALFGHMRFHPNRGWRGIQPPQLPKHASPSSTLSEDQQINSSIVDGSAVDLMESVTGWSVTAKRGRRSLSCCLSFKKEKMEEEEQKEMMEAVNDLLMLACALGGDSSMERGVEVSSPALNIEDQKSSSEAENSNHDIANGKGKVALGYGHAPKSPIHMREKSGFDDVNAELTKTKRKKKKRLVDLEKEGDLLDHVDHQRKAGKRICLICNKVFPSHQALGGHRASHNKTNNVNATKEPKSPGLSAADHQNGDSSAVNTCSTTPKVDFETKVSEEEVEESKQAAGGTATAASGDHQCNICSKSFASGQALGGHKRCHWTPGPPEAAANNPSQLTSPPEDIPSHLTSPPDDIPSQITSPPEAVHKRRLDFDLNEPPPCQYDQ